MVPWTGLFLLSLLFRERPPLRVILLWDPSRVHSWSPLVHHVYAPPSGQIVHRHSITFYMQMIFNYIVKSWFLWCLLEYILPGNTEIVSWAEVIVITLSGPSSNNISNCSILWSWCLIKSCPEGGPKSRCHLWFRAVLWHPGDQSPAGLFCTTETALQVKSFFSPADLGKVIHASVSSRLDYCNALCSGIS